MDLADIIYGQGAVLDCRTSGLYKAQCQHSSNRNPKERKFLQAFFCLSFSQEGRERGSRRGKVESGWRLGNS